MIQNTKNTGILTGLEEEKCAKMTINKTPHEEDIHALFSPLTCLVLHLCLT